MKKVENSQSFHDKLHVATLISSNKFDIILYDERKEVVWWFTTFIVF